MIGAQYVREDEGVFHARLERTAHEKVIDAPSHVAGSGSGEVRPPGIKSLPLMEQTERVYESRLDKVLESGPLLVRKTVLADVLFRIGQVLFRMSHIQVAAKYDRLLFA